MFKGDGYVHYLDCGEGFTGAYIYQNFQTVHFKYVQFIVTSIQLNQAVKTPN